MKKLYEEHTQSCKSAFAQYEQELDLWLKKWGKTYCQECQGNGQFIETYDPSPSGVSLGAGHMTDISLCFCIDPIDDSVSRCPRCGCIWENENDERNTIVEDGLPCPNCGWNWGKHKDDAKPIEPLCFCYEMFYGSDMGRDLQR